jgi:hypothetical protein
MSRRSTPPKGARGPADQQLDELFRRLGKPDASLLAALLDGLTEKQLRDRAEAAGPTPDLLARAVADVSKAYDHWQSLSAEQRKNLRGCSVALFSVAVDQARQLAQLYAQHIRYVAEHEQAKVREQKLMQDAQQVCVQTKGVLLKVAGGRPSIQLAMNEKLADSSNAYAMIANLKYLAEASRSLMQLPAAAVRGRAILYGMDRTFVESLTGLAEQIRTEDEKVSARPSKLPAGDAMKRARAVVWSLLNHISDVFEAARSIEPTTPALRKVDAGPLSGVMPAHKIAETPTVGESAKKAPPAKALHIPRLR